MKARSIAATVAVCFFAMTLCFAENPNLGTWKLNEAKSKLSPGMAKNSTVVYTAEGDSFKVTTDGVDGKGNPMHTEWTGKFDGKAYPLTGDPTADSRSYKQVNERTMSLANKKGGKMAASGRIVVSADGKTRTLTVSATDGSGKKMTNTAMYDKE